MISNLSRSIRNGPRISFIQLCKPSSRISFTQLHAIILARIYLASMIHVYQAG